MNRSRVLVYGIAYCRKYIAICTIFTVQIWIILAFLYDLPWGHSDNNSWEKPTVSSTKMKQWPVTYLLSGKPKAVDNMTSLSCRWHVESSSLWILSCISGMIQNIIYIYNVAIYKTLKRTELTTVRLLLSFEICNLLSIIGWVVRS